MAATVVSRARSHVSGMTGISTGADADMDSAFRQLRSQSGNATSIFMDLEAFFEKSKTGLNNLLHSLTRTSRETHAVFLLGALIEAGQLASLALPRSSTLAMNFPGPVEKFAEILSYTRFGELLWEHFDHFTVAIVVQSILLVELLALPYVAYTWASKEGKSIGTKLLQYQMSVFGGVLFIPIIACLAEGAFCSKFTSSQCSVFMPIAIIELFVYIVLVLLVAIMHFDSRPTSKSMNARPHARVHVLSVFLRAALTLIFVGVHNMTSSGGLTKFWVVFVAGALTMLGIFYTWYQPYYHQRANAIRALLTTSSAWLAVASMIHVFMSSQDDGSECTYTSDGTVTVTVFGGLLLVLPLTWFGLHYRRYTLQTKRPNQCANVYELELKGRLEIQGLGIHHVADLTKADKDAIRQRALRVHKWYMDAASLFPLTGALFMFHAQVLLAFLPQKTPMVRRAIAIGAKRGLAPDFHVIAYKVRRTLEETIKGSSDVLSIVRSEEYTAEALKYDKRCSSQLVEFWSELSEKRPDINKVRRLALNIAVSSSAAHTAYLKLLRISPKSSRVYEMISSFLLEIMHDSRLAAMMRIKGARIAREASARASTNLNEAESDSLGVIVVRASMENRHELGDIVFANANASQILNQVNQMIVGQKIESFLVSPLAERFVEIVDGFLEHGKDEAFEETIQTFLRTPSGNLVAVNLKLQPYAPDDVNFNMYFVFQADMSHAGENFIVVDEADGMVHGMGSACFSAFQSHFFAAAQQRQFNGMGFAGLGPNGAAVERLHVSTLIPNYAVVSPQRFPSGSPIPVTLQEEDTGDHVLRRFRITFNSDPQSGERQGRDSQEASGGRPVRRPSIASLICSDEVEAATRASFTATSLETDTRRASSAPGASQAGDGEAYVMKRSSTTFSPMRRASSTYQPPPNVKGKIWFQHKQVLGKRLLQIFIHDPDVPEFNAVDERFDDRGMTMADGQSEMDDASMGNVESEFGDSDAKRPGGLMRRTFTDKSEHMRRFMDEMGSEAKIVVPPRRVVTGSKAGSRAGSVASGEVLRIKAQAVRKILQESQNAAMDATLAKLRRMYLRASVLVCICATAQYFNSTNLLESYMSDIQLIGSLGFRRYCLVAIAYAAHGLDLVRRGILDASQESSLRSQLNSFAGTLKTSDFDLFQRRSEVGGDLQSLYEDASLDYYTVRNGNIVSSTISLFESTLKISSAALQAEQADLSEFYAGSALTFPLMENLDYFNGTALYGLEQTTQDFADYAYDHAAVILHQLYVIASIMLLVVVILVGVTIYPLVGNGGKIEKVKSEILQVFSDIPKKTTQEVGLRFVERLHSVHEEDVDASRLNGEHPTMRNQEDREGIDPKSGGGGGGGGMLRHLVDASGPSSETQTRDPKKVAKVAPDVAASSERKSAPRHKGGGGSSSKKGDSKAKSNNSCCSVRKVVIGAKMSALLFFSIIYFASIVLLTAKLEWDTSSAPAIANLAGYRRMKTRLVMHEFRLWVTGAFEGVDMVTEGGEHLDFRSSAEHVRYRLGNLQRVHEKLLYGSEADHLTGTFRDPQASDTLMELYTSNGCIDISSGNITEADCEAFDNGLMATGLQSALTNYMDTMQELTYDTEIETIVHSQDNAALRTLFARSDIQRLVELESDFLQPQLTTVIRIENAALASRVAHVEVLMLVLLVGLVLSAFFTYAFVVRAILSRLDTEVKRTRSLLLVIPEDVLDSLRHIQVFLVDSFGENNTRK